MRRAIRAIVPALGAMAIALPALALPGVNGTPATTSDSPAFSDLVLVQGIPPPKGPIPKAPPPKGPPPFTKGPPPFAKGPPPYPGYPGRGVRYMWGGLPFFFYDGYYHGDCSWLRRKARQTGSSYWWRRYRQCRDD